ncbi:unnamed protein product [Darwinula stevensoni]|uniref:Elongation of very long chain fatty acids protein n=1 Tax=Darwinula stevensoni TaxID=69355 RepID=A0A7R9FS58_9CRUS|nr:unnamed protein product [Darwinula stevensoni]CAG0902646.1 unnamed protein product [Darwinula stevensoni]
MRVAFRPRFKVLNLPAVGLMRNETAVDPAMWVEPIWFFPWETHFSYEWSVEWSKKAWPYVQVLAVVYVLLTFLGRRAMKNRQGFNLRYPLIAWNGFLAVFSILGTIKGFQELSLALRLKGFYYSVCDNSQYWNEALSVYGWLFLVSKIFELGDTAFLVLRKSHLVHLHWYHHTTVLLYVFYSYRDGTSTARWFADMNYLVHAFMYSYFTFIAIGYRGLRRVAFGITVLQILQMFMGIFVNLYAVYVKVAGYNCDVPNRNLFWANIMYASYFFLFVQFFVSSYIKKTHKRDRGAKMVSANGFHDAKATPKTSNDSTGSKLKADHTD